jgi:hypothetical protein
MREPAFCMKTREEVANDYESLVQKRKEEARLLARTYEGESVWNEVENKMNMLLAPVGSIENSRESLKLINDFFRRTKRYGREVVEENQDLDIKELRDNMINHYNSVLQLVNIVRQNRAGDLILEIQNLQKTSEKIKFEVLESSIYRMDEQNSRVLQSFLTVFKLRSDDLT